MRFLNIFTFLCTISLTILVIPSFIPKISLLIMLLIVFTIGINSVIILDKAYKKSLWIGDINYGLFPIPIIVIILITFWVFTRFWNNLDSNLYADLILVVSHLFFFIFLVNTKDFIFLYKKYYIFLVFIMSVCGLAANLIISLNLIDISSSYFNLSEATNGAFMRDDDAGPDSYAFPFSLGLVLIGSGKLSFLSFELIRISGWAHEPTSATLFIVPALILIAHGEIFQSFVTRFIMFITIATFWFFAMSVGSFLAILILYPLLFLLIIFINYFPYKLSTRLFIILLLGAMALPFFIEPLLQSSIFTSKFDFTSESYREAVSQLVWMVPGIEKATAYYFSHMFLWMIIILFTFVAFLSLTMPSYKKFPNPYAIILFYVIIHSMKGSQETVFYLFFTIFWFYLAYFSIENKIITSNSFDRTELK
jgi:hypothetical protein